MRAENTIELAGDDAAQDAEAARRAGRPGRRAGGLPQRGSMRTNEGSSMKVLVIGGGGREHALAWKLAQSPKVQRGLRGARQRRHGAATRGWRTCRSPTCAALRDWAQAEKIALTVVGPEAPLAAGVVDEFRAHGLRDLRPDAGRRAAGKLQGVLQGLHEAPRHPDGATTRPSPTPAPAHAYVDAQGRAHRRQGRRPGRGQGRGGGHDAGRSARGHRLHAAATTSWA